MNSQGDNFNLRRRFPEQAFRTSGLSFEVSASATGRITIFGLTREYCEIKSIDQTIGAIARVCKSIRDKVGSSFIVKVQKGWSNPELKNISWMWEDPSDEARGRVGEGLGTHKATIQVLVMGP